MNAETYVTISAAGISLAALYPNFRAMRAAARSADIAEEQTRAQQQPYVWADLRLDDAVGTLINLVIGNSGPTVATNVRVAVKPSLPAIASLRSRAEAAQKQLADGVSSLPPGRSMSWSLGQSFNLLATDGPLAFTFTITADGPFGPIPPLTYVVDLSDWKETLNRPTGSLHQLTQAVEKLTGAVEGQRRDASSSDRG